MDIPVKVRLSDLWGDQAFEKEKWGAINFLVGPNGTGKTRFAEALIPFCNGKGLRVRYLSAERLAGLEKKNYSTFANTYLGRGFDIGRFTQYKGEGANFGLAGSAFIILKEKLDVRIRIEATLSELFGRRIRLAEVGGFLNPMVLKISDGSEYVLREGECHGLKELIALLVFLYDDGNDCLIIDEPELHLHPQFQTFFLQEIRRMAGDPLNDRGKKCFFLITHSPYYVDVRTVEHLNHCIVFQPDKFPAYIEKLEGEDEHRIRQLLLRLNTHHKQFFFASRPIFVEGYRDQHIFTLIQEKRGRLLGASGVCLIDVGGKDEMDLFFRISKKLNIDAQFVCDLDTLLRGKLRQSVSQDDRCKNFVQQEGLGTDLMTTLGELERKIDDCLKDVEPALSKPGELTPSMESFKSALYRANGLSDEKDKTSSKRYAFMLALRQIGDDIHVVAANKIETVKFVEGRLLKIIEAFKSCGVYLLPKGELENHLPSYTGTPYQIPDSSKAEVFEREQEFLFSSDLTEEQICSRYDELASILDETCRSYTVNMNAYLSYAIGDWIHRVQSAFVRREVFDQDSLFKSAALEWQSHSRIFDLVEFSRNPGGFTCRIKLKPLVDPSEREVGFNNETVAANFSLGDDGERKGLNPQT
jgi:hypothetical protein